MLNRNNERRTTHIAVGEIDFAEDNVALGVAVKLTAVPANALVVSAKLISTVAATATVVIGDITVPNLVNAAAGTDTEIVNTLNVAAANVAVAFSADITVGKAYVLIEFVELDVVNGLRVEEV